MGFKKARIQHGRLTVIRDGLGRAADRGAPAPLERSSSPLYSIACAQVWPANGKHSGGCRRVDWRCAPSEVDGRARAICRIRGPEPTGGKGSSRTGESGSAPPVSKPGRWVEPVHHTPAFPLVPPPERRFQLDARLRLAGPMRQVSGWAGVDNRLSPGLVAGAWILRQLRRRLFRELHHFDFPSARPLAACNFDRAYARFTRRLRDRVLRLRSGTFQGVVQTEIPLLANRRARKSEPFSPAAGGEIWSCVRPR